MPPTLKTSSSALPEAADKAQVVESMFDRISPRYDLANRLLTFRMDVGWRRKLIDWLAFAPGARVLDVACGTGDLSSMLQKRRLNPIGIDFSAGMLVHRLSNFPPLRADAQVLPIRTATADGLVCGFALRNLTDLRAFFDEAARTLRPQGRFGILEVSSPTNPLLRSGHQLYFNKIVPFVGGLISDRAAYRYLPESTKYLPEAPALIALIENAGFTAVTRTQLSGGIAQMITAIRAEA